MLFARKILQKQKYKRLYLEPGLVFLFLLEALRYFSPDSIHKSESIAQTVDKMKRCQNDNTVFGDYL